MLEPFCLGCTKILRIMASDFDWPYPHLATIYPASPPQALGTTSDSSQRFRHTLRLWPRGQWRRSYLLQHPRLKKHYWTVALIKGSGTISGKTLQTWNIWRILKIHANFLWLNVAQTLPSLASRHLWPANHLSHGVVRHKLCHPTLQLAQSLSVLTLPLCLVEPTAVWIPNPELAKPRRKWNLQELRPIDCEPGCRSCG